MTKKELKQQLSDLRKWADLVEQNVSRHEALPKNDSDEVTDSRVWDAAASWLKDARYEAYLKMAAQAGEAPPAAPSAPAPAAPPEPDSKIELQNFLRQMSVAMVDAQSMLDAKSAEYLAATAGKPHILPSIFRVPKLNAQMKFAMEVAGGKTINLLFYKRDDKATSRNEQSIDFDVVSVPAPPEAGKNLRFLGPRLDLLLDPFERRGIVDIVKAAGVADLSKLAESAPNSLAVLTLPEQKDRRDYLVLAVTAVKEHSVGLWSLTVPAKGDPQLLVIYPLNRKNSDNEKLFKDLVAEVVRRQEEYFAD